VKPKETDADKLAFALEAMDIEDPFVKKVRLEDDVVSAVQWMAKERLPSLTLHVCSVLGCLCRLNLLKPMQFGKPLLSVLNVGLRSCTGMVLANAGYKGLILTLGRYLKL